MAKLYNLARMTTATTGTGTLTLGAAVAGWLTFALAGVANGDVVAYAIKDGSNSEAGTGTYTSAGTTLSRTPVTSTNGNAAISLSGTAEVYITALKEDIANLREANTFTAAMTMNAALTYGGVTLSNSVTGTGSMVLATSPTLTTQVTVPLVIGGTAASSTLTLESTSGAGTTDSIIWKTASQVTRATMDSSGQLNIGATAPIASSAILQIQGTTDITSKFGIGRYSADALGPGIGFVKSRSGTVGAFTVPNLNDVIGTIQWIITDGTTYRSSAEIRAEVDATPGATDSPGRLIISTTRDGAGAITECARFNKDGTFSIPGSSSLFSVTAAGACTAASFTTTGLTTTSTISLTGGQITFPAAASVSAGANVLDDYEEGTWTPSLGGSATYTTRAATYTKIGRVVFIRMHMQVNAIGTGSTNTISGLPFTADYYYSLSVSTWTSGAVSPVFVAMQVANGATTMSTTGATGAAASSSNPLAIFGSGTEILACGFYQTTS